MRANAVPIQAGLMLLVAAMQSSAATPPSSAYTSRVVVTFRNASLNAEVVVPDNTTVVKQYGRRLVLRIAGDSRDDEDTEGEGSHAHEWIQEALGGKEYIERVEQDVLASAFDMQNASFYSNNYTETNADAMMLPSPNDRPTFLAIPAWLTTGWNLNESEPYSLRINSLRRMTDGFGATIAIIDSGISHAGRMLFRPAVGYDFVSSPDYSNKPNQTRNPDYSDPGDQGPTCPTPSWHGTKVTSVAMAIAPGAALTIMRVLGQCGVGFSSDIADAIVWAAGGQINGLDTNPNPATTISLSLAGMSPCPSYLQSAVNQARSLGATVIAAAGNAAQNVSMFFPANCNGVIAIGASTRQGTLASYSNWGAGLAFSAPGGDASNPIRVLGVVDGLLAPAVATGTSFSAPHAAGLGGILQSLGLRLETAASLIPFSRCDSAKMCERGILSTSIQPSLNLLVAPGGGERTNSTGSATASGSCIAELGVSAYSGWAGRKQSNDVEGSHFCPYPCHVTSVVICRPGQVNYIKVGCSDGSYSNQIGRQGACSHDLAEPASQGGFTRSIIRAGADINGGTFYSVSGVTTPFGCLDNCQTGYDLQCPSGVIIGIIVFHDPYYVHSLTIQCSSRSCPADYYMSVTSYQCKSCDRCDAGNYISGCGGTNEGMCNACARDCPDFQYRANCGASNPGSCAWCAECGPGTKFVGCTGGTLYDSRTCASCEPGKYNGGGRTRECLLCRVGKYNPTPGSSTEASCIACPSGKYNPNIGSASFAACLNCDAGKINIYSGKSSISDCTPCPKGRYSTMVGLGTFCPSCGPGTYADREGMTACNLCSAGTYEQYTNGMVSADQCTRCQTGKYSTALGATDPATCRFCELGKFGPSTGLSTCDRCAAGTFALTAGLSACTACASGKYSAVVGLSGACTNCDAGKFSTGTGAPSSAACQACAAGSCGPSPGASACVSCVAGKFAGTAGKTDCDACPPGTFTATQGTIACSACVAIANCAVASESTCIPDFGSKCVPCASIYACVYQSNVCLVGGVPACLCNPGFELLDGRCSGCAAGKFKAVNGTGPCAAIRSSLVCPQGKYLQQGTAFADSACVDCPPLPPNTREGVSGCEWSCSAGFDNNAP